MRTVVFSDPDVARALNAPFADLSTSRSSSR
jgi:hypothetical protein